MRYREVKVTFLVMMAMVAALCIGACAAPLTQIQKAQEEFSVAKVEAERVRKEREAKEEAARQARQSVIDAEGREMAAKGSFASAKRVEAERIRKDQEAKAAELDRRARELREQAGKDAATLEREAAELVPSPPAAPLPVKAVETEFVDVEIKGMAVDQIRRLSELPKDWTLSVNAEAQKLELSIAGKLAKSFGPPAEGFGGRTLCWRLFKDEAEACPVKAAVPVP